MELVTGTNITATRGLPSNELSLPITAFQLPVVPPNRLKSGKSQSKRGTPAPPSSRCSIRAVRVARPDSTRSPLWPLIYDEPRDALALSVSDSNSRNCSARLSFTRRRGERPLPFRGLGSEADPCPRRICDTWPCCLMVSPLILSASLRSERAQCICTQRGSSSILGQFSVEYSRSQRRSSDRCMLLRVTLTKHDLSFLDFPAPVRNRPDDLRTAEAIRTNDGVLDTPTIDAACAGV